jgi:hypothetical protein
MTKAIRVHRFIEEAGIFIFGIAVPRAWALSCLARCVSQDSYISTNCSVTSFPSTLSHTSVPIMERVEPDAYFNGAVTSTFRFDHSNGIPAGSDSHNIVYGRSCGLGWRFGIACDVGIINDGNVELQIYFNLT